MTILNEREYRIFLSAMSREEKVCKLLDDKDGCQNKGIKLVPICKSIKHKIKSAIPAKYAYWVNTDTEGKYNCSACKKVFDYRYNYCPNCGSQMDIGRD